MESEVLSAPPSRRSVAKIADSFWKRALPHEEWNHAAHLAVALDAVARWGSAEALAQLREGICVYNEANEVQNSPMSGYHETLTIFFVSAVADFYRQHEGQELEVLYPALLDLWGDKNAVLTFYSRRHLFSPYARMGWKAPDLRPLPFAIIEAD